MSKYTLFNYWFSKGNKNIIIKNFKQIRKRNFEVFGYDPDMNINRRWGIHTNGAVKGNPKDTCLDWQLDLGHIHFNYTNFDYNKKYRK